MAETYMIEVTPIVAVALAVIAGRYGDGDERVARLKGEGYDPALIQGAVNDLLGVLDKYKEASDA